MKTEQIVCIVCPRGCHTLVREKNGRVEVEKAECTRGIEYAQREYIEPVRILTTTLAVESEGRQRLSVRTKGKIHKKLLIPCIQYLKKIKAVPPVGMGKVIVENLLDTGIDLIATNEIE